MCCRCCGESRCRIWIFIFGALVSTIGYVALLVWPNLAHKLVQSNQQLEKGTDTYNSWVEAPIPIYIEFYMFNWTNPEEIRNPYVKPKFHEMGPYVFLEKHLKENITFYDNNTVSYYEKCTWFFVAERSHGTLDDLITAAHVITATAVDKMRRQPTIVKAAINSLLNSNGGKLYATKSAREWIFDGYQDDLLDFLSIFKTTNIKIPFKRFGWLVNRNGSTAHNGLFTIHTGNDDISKLGRLTHWNGRTQTGFYEMPCGVVNGSTGDLFPPNMNPKAAITIFTSEAARYLNLQPNGTMQHQGISGVRWIGNDETVGSAENYPDQQCFCTHTAAGECQKPGVFGCKKSHHGAPIYVSFPHFYLAHPSYRNAVEGMTPAKAKHQFSIAVEPTMGITLNVHGRLQINLLIDPDKDFDIYRGLPKVLMPIFWFDRHAELTPELASRAKLALNLGSYGVNVGIGLIAFGNALLVVAIVLTLNKRYKSSPTKKITSAEAMPMFYAN